MSIKDIVTPLKCSDVVGFEVLLCCCECCSCGMDCECVAGLSVSVYGDEVLSVGFKIADAPCWISDLWLWDVV